jgi:hypothetical protein
VGTANPNTKEAGQEEMAQGKKEGSKRKEAKRDKPFVEVPDPDPEEEVIKRRKRLLVKEARRGNRQPRGIS